MTEQELAHRVRMLILEWLAKQTQKPFPPWTHTVLKMCDEVCRD